MKIFFDYCPRGHCPAEAMKVCEVDRNKPELAQSIYRIPRNPTFIQKGFWHEAFEKMMN